MDFWAFSCPGCSRLPFSHGAPQTEIPEYRARAVRNDPTPIMKQCVAVLASSQMRAKIRAGWLDHDNLLSTLRYSRIPRT